MARKTPEDSQRTRDAILDAAEQVLTAKSVSTATVTDIADAAGLSRGAVYGHYGNKMEVAVAMCRRTLDRVVMQSPLQGESPLWLLSTCSLQFLQLARSSNSLQRVLEVLYLRCEPSPENQPLLQLRADFESAGWDNVAALMRAAIADGELPTSLDLEMARAYLQSLVGGIYNTLTCTRRLDNMGMEGVEALLAAGIDTLRHSSRLRSAMVSGPVA